MKRLRPLAAYCLLLGAFGCGNSTGFWIEQTKSEDPAKRLHAVHMLQGKSKEGAVVVPVLIESMKDTNLYVRRDAARALGAFGPDASEAVVPLLARLGDPEPSVRKAATQALKDIDPTSLPK